MKQQQQSSLLISKQFVKEQAAEKSSENFSKQCG